MTGKTGHPLPGSDEARHDEIPESAERDKGRGDDPATAVQPAGDPVEPDGEPYGYRPPGRNNGAGDELLRDQRAHQDRGQSELEDDLG
jgi:hypothetical protein